MINIFAFDLQCNTNAEGNGLPDDSSKRTKRTGATEDMPITPFFIMRNELMMFAFISVQYVCIVVCF
jgi:hypothetical protein